MEQQNDTPLLNAVLEYVHKSATRYNTPGHKQGKGMHPLYKEILGQRVLDFDVSLTPDLDNLHEAQGCIKKTQELAAQLYGADHSFFLINGTTVGIHAMILATVGPGKKIIIPRNVHRSIIGGIILSGAIPVFMSPEIDFQLEIAMGVTPDRVKKAIREHPDAKAVLVINPTYYGVATDLGEISKIVHENNMVLLVDEAHGPHLKFSDQLPLSALEAEADIVVQSSHKILGALTQCSSLHCKKAKVDVPKLKTMLQMLQSTSPNYLFLVSLDVARMQMGTTGVEQVSKTIELANRVREQINTIPGLYCFGKEKIGNPGVYALDPTKINVCVKGLGLTGAEVEKILLHEYKIQPEMSDMFNVLFLFTIGDQEKEANLLIKCLCDLAQKHRNLERTFTDVEKIYQYVFCTQIPQQILSPREAMFSAKRTIPFERAAGHVCGEIVSFYPPGIPLLCPGEYVTNSIIEYCRQLQGAGLKISGPEDSSLATLKVVEL